MRKFEGLLGNASAVTPSVPLFNQKKRNRIPLTSSPSENQFFSHMEYVSNSNNSSDDTSGAINTHRFHNASGSSFGAPRTIQWNRQSNSQNTQLQQHGSHKPTPVSTSKSYAPIPHPYKTGGTRNQPNIPVIKQDSSFRFRQPNYQGSLTRIQGEQSLYSGLSQMSQRFAHTEANPQVQKYPQQSTQLPPPLPLPCGPTTPGSQPQNSPWKCPHSFGSQRSSPVISGKRNKPQAGLQTQAQAQPTHLMKQTTENSLRILTAVIDGMRHWSNFKDKFSFLFEIFATLDSAVTMGPHGAKNFLLRDRSGAVRCVFYENEQDLPRLIRGQVHRCLGNYDRSRDLLTCVSIRPGVQSEMSNTQETIKVCDEEMRLLVKSLKEY